MHAVNILIVDDEVLIAEYLKDILISYDIESIKMAHSRRQAMAEISACMPDIILLDIKMDNDLAGISMAEEIGRLNRIPIIFITAYSDKETVEAALKTKPAAYITKPLKKADVFAAVSIAIKDLEGRGDRYFTFKDGYTTVRLLTNDILYVKSKGNYITIVTADKKYSIRQTLDWCSGNLPSVEFERIHRSYIVNLGKIEKSTARHAFIKGAILPLARNRRKNL